MSEQPEQPAPAATQQPAPADPPAEKAGQKQGKKKPDTYNAPANRKGASSSDELLSFIFKEAPKFARLCVVLPNGFVQGVEDLGQLSRVGDRILFTTSKGIYTVRDLFLQQPVDIPKESKIAALSAKNAELEQKAVAEAKAKTLLQNALEAKKKELEDLQRKLAAASEPALRR